MYDYAVDRNLNKLITMMSPIGFCRGILRPNSGGDQIHAKLNFNQQRGVTGVNSSADLLRREVDPVWKCKKTAVPKHLFSPPFCHSLGFVFPQEKLTLDLILHLRLM